MAPRQKATTMENPLKRSRNASSEGEDAESSAHASSSRRERNAVVGRGMRGTLLAAGKSIEREPLPVIRKQHPLPQRRQNMSSSSSAAPAGHGDTEEDDDDDEPLSRPRKKRKTQSVATSEDEEVFAAPLRSSRATSVIDVDDDEDNDQEETEEQKLAKKARSWTSPVYGFFKEAYLKNVTENKKQRVVHRFDCNHCKDGINRYQDTADKNSLSGLKRHVLRCMGKLSYDAVMQSGSDPATVRKKLAGQAKGGNQNIASMFDGQRKAGIATYSNVQHTPTQTRAEIVRWVSENCRPYEVVADRGFKSLMKTGRPMYWIPAPTTVARDVKKAFAKTRQRIAQLLRDFPGEIHVATDGWTSGNHGAYVAITAHLLDEADEPIIVLLDFLKIPKSHTGATLAAELVRVLKEFGIDEKMGCVTADNATAMDAMAESMGHLLPTFGGRKQRIRLFDPQKKKTRKRTTDQDVSHEDAEDLDNDQDDWGELDDEAQHIADGDDLELTEEEQAALDIILAEIADEEGQGADPKDNDEDSDDEDPGDLDDDEDGLVDKEEVIANEQERKDLYAEAKPIRTALIKIRTIAFKIINSSTKLLPAWRQHLRKLMRKVRIIPRDVRTRWNSTYNMLRFAFDYRNAITEFTATAANGLRKWELSEAEWGLLGEMLDILKTLKRATTFFSTNQPVLADVIPYIDEIDELLTSRFVKLHTEQGTEERIQISAAFKTCCILARRTLNKYYQLTDDTAAYRIAMILHPSHKLEYFSSSKWEQDWISEATNALRTAWTEDYASRDDLLPLVPDEKATNAAGSTSAPTSHAATLWAQRHKKSAMTVDDELETYLKADTEPVDNVIRWWVDHRGRYPRLSRMALDYHTIPATSVAVERCFSRARRLISWERNRLSAQSVRALMCLGSWSLMGMVHDEDLAVIARDGAVKVPRQEEKLVDIDLPPDFDVIMLDPVDT